MTSRGKRHCITCQCHVSSAERPPAVPDQPGYRIQFSGQATYASAPEATVTYTLMTDGATTTYTSTYPTMTTRA